MIPKHIAEIKEAPLKLDSLRGVAGGVPGGVPGGQLGGVLGGVIGGVLNSAVKAVPPPPPPVQPNGPVRVGGHVRQPKVIVKVLPKYPELAREAHVQGQVQIDAVLGPQGNVIEMKVVSGHPLLYQAALNALKQWKYEPDVFERSTDCRADDCDDQLSARAVSPRLRSLLDCHSKPYRENAMSDLAPVPDFRPVWLDEKTKSIMDRAIAREQSLSRLLMTYIVTGLIFMLLPGTFLGVWNLIKIGAAAKPVNSVSPAWIQAHGHAQLFGWVGTFILGIGFYSIPKLRKLKPFALREGWLCLALWIVGVTSRRFANIYPWHWRVLLPVSAALKLLAFLIFFRAVASHRPASGAPKPWEPWIFLVVAATMGLLTSLLLNLGASIQLARDAVSPAFSHEFDQRYLIVSTWGFLVPMVWGFSSRWLPVFMGLRPLRNPLLLAALALNTLGVVAGLFERFTAAGILLLGERRQRLPRFASLSLQRRQPKTINVHASFPIFIRIAYGWLLAATVLSVWASLSGEAAGIWGASRHALTVGFIAGMVFCVGQRVLPSFCGMRVLWSPRLMLWMLILLMTGCTLRVASKSWPTRVMRLGPGTACRFLR